MTRQLNNAHNNKKGFTLIELLVVIAIIGILSGIGLVSLNGAREKARDAQRLNDLAQYRTAFILYSDSNNSKYPPTNSGTDIASAGGDCIARTGRRYVDNGGNSISDVSTFFTHNIFIAGYAFPIIPTFLTAPLVPPINPVPATGTTQGQYVYCYDTNGDAPGETLNAFFLYTKLESGAQEWYYLDHAGRSVKTTSAHTTGACIHNGSTNPCNW